MIFPQTGSGRVGEDDLGNDSSVIHSLCILFLLLLHQLHLRSSGIRSQRVGTPVLQCPVYSRDSGGLMLMVSRLVPLRWTSDTEMALWEYLETYDN